MSRRKTVKLNIPATEKKIKAVFRHNVIFCEKMGRGNHLTWVTDWNRKDENGNPKPKNLPSPEEAARMCVLLQTTPEEILVEQADIDLVNGLLEQEREKSAKKERPADGGTLSGEDKETAELREIWNSADSDERQMLLEIAKTLKARRK